MTDSAPTHDPIDPIDPSAAKVSADGLHLEKGAATIPIDLANLDFLAALDEPISGTSPALEAAILSHGLYLAHCAEQAQKAQAKLDAAKAEADAHFK